MFDFLSGKNLLVYQGKERKNRKGENFIVIKKQNFNMVKLSSTIINDFFRFGFFIGLMQKI